MQDQRETHSHAHTSAAYGLVHTLALAPAISPARAHLLARQLASSQPRARGSAVTSSAWAQLSAALQANNRLYFNFSYFCKRIATAVFTCKYGATEKEQNEENRLAI